jgi:hypothetical protein
MNRREMGIHDNITYGSPFFRSPPFPFGNITIKMNKYPGPVFGPGLLMNPIIPVNLEEGQIVGNPPVLNLFYKGTESAVDTAADKHDIFGYTKKCSQLLIPVLNAALQGCLPPTGKAAGTAVYGLLV